MSVSSINPATAQTHQHARGGSSGTSSASGTSGAAATSGNTAASTSTSTSADAPASSTIVTLSPDAQTLASLAAEGVSFSLTSMASLGISASDIANATTPAQQYALAQRVHQGLISHGDLMTPGGSVSQSGFENLVTQFGGTKTQADQLFQSLDTNGDGSVSTDEFLDGMGSTSGDSPVAQSLLELMDTDGSGSVNSSEFINFEMAFAQTENGKA
jgi:hypothetical protein